MIHLKFLYFNGNMNSLYKDTSLFILLQMFVINKMAASWVLSMKERKKCHVVITVSKSYQINTILQLTLWYYVLVINKKSTLIMIYLYSGSGEKLNGSRP